MARIVRRLTAVGVNRLKQPGIYSDGGNLNFRVAPGGVTEAGSFVSR